MLYYREKDRVMQASSFFIGPHKTPKSVKWLILLTTCISILSPICTYFLGYFFQISGPSDWFSLSAWGLKQGWAWQIATYFFLNSSGVGISISFLISLSFHMLVLWFTGSEIALRFKTLGFLLFYLGSGIVAGLFGALLLFLFSSPVAIVGSTPAILALLLVWAMLYPELELFFLFLIRIRAKVLIAALIGIALLLNLSSGEFIQFFVNLTALVWGFCIGRIVWKLPNPYPLNLDLPKKAKRKKEGKIIDISAFQEKDDAFMDRMLDKIARDGGESLTKRERQRMEKISKRKQNENGS